MAVKIKTKSGTIDIDNDVISSVVGGAATDNYGVIGMASRNPLRDGVNQILRRETSPGALLSVSKTMVLPLTLTLSSAMARRSLKYRRVFNQK